MDDNGFGMRERPEREDIQVKNYAKGAPSKKLLKLQQIMNS